MNDTIETPEEKVSDEEPKLRLWPALLFVAIGLGISLVVAQFGSTNDHNIIGMLGAPLGASLLILLWWLFGSRMSWKDRILGLCFLVVTLGGLFISQEVNAPFMMVVAVPYFTYGVVLTFALMYGRPWVKQRMVAAAYLILCVGMFSMMRVDSFGGDLEPEVHWRWEPKIEVSTADVLTAKSPGEIADVPLRPGPYDWPAFRGMDRDSHLIGVKFSSDWSTPPRELWRKPVGVGWSSFTVVGDYLFTQEQRGEQETVICYSADTGEEIWINSVVEHFVEVTGPGPRATPTFLDGKLYVQGATGILQCMDASTGTQIWQRDLRKDTGATVPTWGFSSSPLIVGGRVIQYSGGSEKSSVVAYDLATGDLVWNTGKGKDGYGSAHYTHISNVPQVLVNSSFGIQSFIAETGEVLWEHNWRADSYPRVVQPVLTKDGGVMIGTSGKNGTRRLNVSKQDKEWLIEEQWTTKKFRPYFNDYILHEGYCYGFDGNRLMCIDVETGERKWKGDRVGGQLLFIRDMQMLLILTEEGEVMLVEAQPKEYKVVSKFKAISGKTWNHPVVAKGRLYVRNSNEMACFELAPAS